MYYLKLVGFVFSVSSAFLSQFRCLSLPTDFNQTLIDELITTLMLMTAQKIHVSLCNLKPWGSHNLLFKLGVKYFGILIHSICNGIDYSLSSLCIKILSSLAHLLKFEKETFHDTTLEGKAIDMSHKHSSCQLMLI